MRKGFFIKPEDVATHVYDAVSKFVPDQSLPLREMLLQFSYLSGEKLAEIVNRGFDGDEDDEFLEGLDVFQLDFAEIHDRLMDLQPKERKKVLTHAPQSPEPAPPVEEVTPEPSE